MRTIPQQLTDRQATLQHFSQILTIDMACSNALRSLRDNDKENVEWMEVIQQDEWMF
jgi:hypothetical protein